MKTGFSQKAKEALRYYVYALVDPRDNNIFYIGKGKNDRVFDHVRDALKNEDNKNLKFDTIREIINEGKEVGQYILWHNIQDEKTAYIIEAALIAFYKKFINSDKLTNIDAGHHQWDEGIMPVDEVELTYNCEELKVNDCDNILLVSLNKSYDQAKAERGYRRPDIYEATCKYWKVSKKKIKDMNIKNFYVCGVHKGIIRSVIKVQSSTWIKCSNNGNSERCIFEGILLNDSPYLNKDVSKKYPFGRGAAVRYIKNNKNRI